ncbi:hypothetical protein J3D56_001018 [Erwinia persicina]|uniref:Uncharacterized protein n=1 Tax=Erwinia aeris TaxID=3239803 RepID=A0ABV4E4E6_9GAMM|nr:MULTISPECIES: hypothetical protein [Erwinia]MCP1437582.1 hypothetical protein [Erwinia persicina]MDN4626494.1 hypothetical protein [Erwinia sp. PsM31]
MRDLFRFMKTSLTSRPNRFILTADFSGKAGFMHRTRSVLPDGRHAMLYRVEAGEAGVYLVQLTEIVTVEDSLINLPQGLLTGKRPHRLTLKGGCYDIAFDSLDNIEADTPFFKRRFRGQRAQALNCIIDYIIDKHYTAYRPYCYTFLAFDELLSRAYRLRILQLSRSQPQRIAAVYPNLDPHRRGYAVKLR